MKFYGTELCPHCVKALAELKEQNAEFEFINITGSTANLKEFLRMRDNRPEFAEVRAEGRIGIPCFVEGEAISFTLSV